MPHRHSLASLSAMRRRSRALLALVLPALVLRALIPFGFMPVAGNGGPTMELCPGAVASSGHGHMHHHQGGSVPASAHAVCAFAASAAPALSSVVLASLPAAGSLAAGRAADPASIRLPSILRAQAARAPPSLA